MDVSIEKLVYGGEGLARAEGATVFVPFVLPGERVRLRNIERKKKFIRGRVQELLETSPERVTPACRHFTVCGGCHYQHMTLEAQLARKTEILRETLARLGKIAWDGPITPHASPPLGYRNRAQWKIRPQGEATAIGYFQQGTSALCAVEECPVLSPGLTRVFVALRALVTGGAFSASVREVEAFVDDASGAVLLNVDCADFSQPPRELAQVLREAIPAARTLLLHDSSADRYHLDGDGHIEYKSGDKSFRVGHLSFFQGNRFLAEELAETAVAGARGVLALDLYAGVGLFTSRLAAQFARVAGVESNPAAARDLEFNTSAAAKNVVAVQGDVAATLRSWREHPDFVLLDPPRTGADAAVLERIVALAPRHVTYVSCDPATLARDLALLVKSGYAVSEIHFFDMFPQTFHIEALVRLELAA